MTNPINAPQGANAPSLSLDPITWASTHPDAELLTAWREYVRVFGVYNALPPMTMAEIAPWDVLLNTLSERVETIPARTMEGMHVKLRYLLESTEEKHLVGRVVICGDPITEEFLNWVNRDFRPKMLWRMIQDTKPGSFPAAPGPAKGISSIDTPNNPDAALLAAWEEYSRLYRTIDALPESDAVRAPHMEALAAESDRITTLPAHTPAGALVKAKLVFIGYEEAGAADAVLYGNPLPVDVLTDYRERMMMALIGDLERMKGVGNTHTPGPAKGVASTDTLADVGIADISSTVIPVLGMTFAAAYVKAMALLTEANALIATGSEEGEEAGEDLVMEACAIRLTLFTTPPQMPADALAILNWLAHPEHGLSGGVHGRIEGQESALVLLRDFMAMQVSKGVSNTHTPPVSKPTYGVHGPRLPGGL